MSSPEDLRCGKCGAELATFATEGVCPACLLELGLSADPRGGPRAVVESIPAAGEKTGDRIGRYKLLEQIGQGGMGTVWMAEQNEPVRRRVALKIIKLGMDTRQVVARFESERQALALMDHPNIAKVHDGGATEAGRPYFVMELVRGAPITEYCDAHRLPTRQRLELFTQVCEAIQHAHQKGIIHRDLKPSNILVADIDDVPRPKVIDFGIAKAIAQPLTDKTLFTRFHQLIGTPAYMSPEQAGAKREDIDTRSDVYSLGVLLYELLTGRPPFDSKMLRDAGLEAVLKTIREVEPSTPSALLSTLTQDELLGLGLRHSETPAHLSRLLRGDLDWIVMKCLEKDRGRRYENANDLAMDIRRHLNQEPVVARPPTAAYRIQKFARRNRLMVVAAGLVTSALVLGLGISSWMYFRESKARERTMAAEKKNKDLADVEKDLRLKAEAQTHIANAMRLAAHSQGLRSQAPVLSALLATEAVEVTRKHGKPVLPLALEGLFYALATIGGHALSGHQLPVTTVLMSPDGHWLVTAGLDNVARLWDLTAQEPWSNSYALRGHNDSVNVAVFSPDSRLLVTGSQDGTARLWRIDRPSPKDFLVLDGEQTSIRQLVFSPSGQWLATQSRDERRERLIVWELGGDYSTLRKSKLVDASTAVSRATADLIVTADGPWLVTPKNLFPYSGGVRLWDLRTSEREARSLTTDRVHRAAISPNRHWLAAAVQDQGAAAARLLLWDLRKQVLANTTTVLDSNQQFGLLSPIDFSDDDRFLTIGNGKHVYVVDLNSEKPGSAVRHIIGQLGPISRTAISHDGRWLALGDRDGTVRLWDLFAEGSEPIAKTPNAHARGVHSIVVSPDGRWLATGNGGGTAQVWQLGSQDPEVAATILRGHDGEVADVFISPDSRWLVTASSDDSVPRLWDLRVDNPYSQEIVLRTSGTQWFDPEHYLSPNRQWLAARGNPWRVWNLKTDDPVNTAIDLPLSNEAPASLRDALRGVLPGVISDRWLVTGLANESLQLWDLKAKDPAASPQSLLDSFNRRPTICVSPDDKWLAVANMENIRLWDLSATRAISARTLRISGRITSLGISPDSRWLVAGDGNNVRLWDLTDPEDPGRELTGHLESVSQIIFNKDKGWLFTASIESVRVWNLSLNDISAPFRIVRLGKFAPRPNSTQSREIRVSPDGRWFVTATTWGKGDFELWHLPVDPSSDAHRLVEARGSSLAVFSPDSHWLITAADGTATLWDLSAEATEATKRSLHGGIASAAFSPDSRWLATGGTTRLWDLHNSTLTPVVLHGDTPLIARAVEFTADGRWLITVRNDMMGMSSTARLWDMDLERLIEKVRHQAGRDFTPEERATYHLDSL